MILEHGVSDDDATVWVVVLWFEFDLVFVICAVFGSLYGVLFCFAWVLLFVGFLLRN